LHSANDIIRAVGAQVNAQGELNMALDTANFLLEDAITLLDEWFAPDAVEPIDGGSRGPDGGCSHEP
jgi:hypothetical protein